MGFTFAEGGALRSEFPASFGCDRVQTCKTIFKKSVNRTRRAFVKPSNAFNGKQEHYSVLGLRMDASAADIKMAFRRLARQYHPDVNKSPGASSSFQSIRLAYEVLSSESSRARYDRTLRMQELKQRRNWGRYSESELSSMKRQAWNDMIRRARERKSKRFYAASEYSFSFDDEDVVEEGKEQEHTDDLPERLCDFLKNTLFMIICSGIYGPKMVLHVCVFVAILSRHLTPTYKFAHLLAWLIGGYGGIFIVFALPFVRLFHAKFSDNVVVSIVLSLWMATNMARVAPVPQGAILALTYMSYKLQLQLS